MYLYNNYYEYKRRRKETSERTSKNDKIG